MMRTPPTCGRTPGNVGPLSPTAMRDKHACQTCHKMISSFLNKALLGFNIHASLVGIVWHLMRSVRQSNPHLLLFGDTYREAYNILEDNSGAPYFWKPPPCQERRLAVPGPRVLMAMARRRTSMARIISGEASDLGIWRFRVSS